MNERRKLTNGGFEIELKKIYPHYEVLGDYIDQNTEITIKCTKHNVIFKSVPRIILRSNLSGCTECIKLERSESFIKYLKINHPNIDSNKALEDYVNHTTPINLYCRLHKDEIIYMSPATVMKGGRNNKKKDFICKSCKREFELLKKFTDWVDSFNGIFPNHNFDFSNSNYTIDYTKSGKGIAKICNILCKDCGKTFSAKSDIFKSSGLCPECCIKSTGEIFIESWLESNFIEFKSQVRISHELVEGKFKGSDIILDFLTQYNDREIWIEYNGEQHYTWCKHFQTLEKFEGQIKRDNNIRNYCKNNNIILIEIPYKFRTKESVWNLLNEIIINGKSPNDLITLPEINYNRGGKRNEQ